MFARIGGVSEAGASMLTSPSLRGGSAREHQKSDSVAHHRDVPFARRDVLQVEHVAGMQLPPSPSVAVRRIRPGHNEELDCIFNGLICDRIARVLWRADAAGNLTSVSGAYEDHCL
jgi:hypothetical protein